jgi:hypothetical protein
LNVQRCTRVLARDRFEVERPLESHVIWNR